MEKLEIEVFSQATNAGVIRMSGREIPGLVIQGDSLSILVSLAESISNQVKDMSNEELVGEVNELYELLKIYLQHYEKVLNEHNIKLPYGSKSL